MPTTIRLATERDAERIREIYLPAVLDSPTSFETEPPSVSAVRESIVTTLANYPWLVCEHDGAVRGYAYAGPHRTRAAYRWSVETSVYVDDDAHRSGVGRGLYDTLLTLVALQGFYNAYAGITLPNAASVGLHESMGFRPIGIYRSVGHKFGQWHDVGWWQLPLREHGPGPAIPATPADSSESDAWEAALRNGASKIQL